jgi:type IV pilus assembly protein PilE
MRCSNTSKRATGFTLIEVMVVVAIVAILARVAYPSYLEHVTRGKRAEGKTALLKAAQLQERNYVANSTYVGTAGLADLMKPGYGGPIYSGEDPTSATGNYTITVAAGPSGNLQQDFVLTATQNAAAHFSDAKCGNLTLSSSGVRGRDSGTWSVSDCWNR